MPWRGHIGRLLASRSFVSSPMCISSAGRSRRRIQILPYPGRNERSRRSLLLLLGALELSFGSGSLATLALCFWSLFQWPLRSQFVQTASGLDFGAELCELVLLPAFVLAESALLVPRLLGRRSGERGVFVILAAAFIDDSSGR